MRGGGARLACWRVAPGAPPGKAASNGAGAYTTSMIMILVCESRAEAVQPDAAENGEKQLLPSAPLRWSLLRRLATRYERERPSDRSLVLDLL